MDQRALPASALVLGCLAAAGIGGYVAVRQVTPAGASAPAGTTREAPERASAAVDPATPNASEPRAAQVTASEAIAPVGKAPDRPTPVAAVTRRTPTPPVAPPPMDVPRSTPPVVAPSALPGVSAPPQAEHAADAERSGGTESIDESPIPSSVPVAEATRAPEPVRQYEPITIPANAVIGIQMEQTVSTESARVEDRVRARVTRDLVVAGDVVVPRGARLIGHVVLVEEGGRVKERARLGLRFHTLVLLDGTEVAMPTEIVYRDGDSPTGRSAKKIGGAAIGGAVLGAILGGGKGAAIGAATGAGSGAGWAMTDDRQPAVIRAGQSLTVRLADSVTTHVER